jgi:hypothetical protein
VGRRKGLDLLGDGEGWAGRRRQSPWRGTERVRSFREEAVCEEHVASSEIRDLALHESRLVPSMVIVKLCMVGHGSFFFTRVLRLAEENCAGDALNSIEGDNHEEIKLNEIVECDAKPLHAQIFDGFDDRRNGAL